MSLRASAFAGRERRDRLAGRPPICALRFGQALGRAGRAAPREQLLFADRRVVQRRVEALARTFFFAASPRSAALRSRRASGAVSPCAAERDRGREFGAQRRFEIARDQHVRSARWRRYASVWAWPSPSIQRPRSAPAPMRLTSFARSAAGFGRDVRARARGAQLAQHARDRRERGPVQRFGPVRRHDRVEHERFDVARVRLGVLARPPSCHRRSRTARAFHSPPPARIASMSATVSAVV